MSKVQIPPEMVSVFCTIAEEFYANPLNVAEFENWEKLQNLEKDVQKNE